MVALVAIFVSSSQPAAAADAAAKRAEAHTQRGLDLRRAGDDLAALPEFQASYDLSPTPKAASQLGLCMMAVGRWVDAEHFLSEGLQSGSDPWIVKNRDVLRESVSSTKLHLGFLNVRGEPTGTSLRINGLTAGSIPLRAPIRVPAGEIVIEGTSTGYSPYRKAVVVSAGEQRDVFIQLVPIAPITSENAGITVPTQDVVDHSEEASARPYYSRPWVWAAVGVGVGLVVAAVVLSSGHETRDSLQCPECISTVGVPVK
jgi:hypothetical protein